MILLSATLRRPGAMPHLFAVPEEALLSKTIESLTSRLGGVPRVQFLDPRPNLDLTDVLVQILHAEEVA